MHVNFFRFIGHVVALERTFFRNPLCGGLPYVLRCLLADVYSPAQRFVFGQVKKHLTCPVNNITIVFVLL